MSRHSQSVSPGTFIAKPIGPDFTTQIVAGQGESVTIWDMEVYADSRMGLGGKDMMVSTDRSVAGGFGNGRNGSTIRRGTPRIYLAMTLTGMYANRMAA